MDDFHYIPYIDEIAEFTEEQYNYIKQRLEKRMTGKIKKIVQEKGFGFIRSDDGSEYFFHFTGCESKDTFDRMKESDMVHFDEVNGPKGKRAENIKLI